MPKTLLVGEAPPKSRMRDSELSVPFSGNSGRRLNELIGQDVTQAFDTRNLLSLWPGASSHGSLFPIKEARGGVIQLLRTLPVYHTRVILAGSRVAKAFKVSDLPQLEWKTKRFVIRATPGGSFRVTREICLARIPHPSGVNMAWNDPRTAELVGEFLITELERS